MNICSPFFVFSFLAALLPAFGAQDSRSSKIDELVGIVLEEKGISANPLTDDQTFLRRTYLELVGRIPTPQEAEEFHLSDSSEKRTELIDQLVGSEGYVSHHFNFWADVLRINRKLQQGGTNTENAYRLWLKDSLRTNKPYDGMVQELVSARGLIWENGAVGYYQRDRGMPLDNMSNTVRVFLGTRLECAQCHDHPFDQWTQMDYFKMAAFSYGVQAQSYGGAPNRNLFDQQARDMAKKAIANVTGMANFPYKRGENRFQKYVESSNFDQQLKRRGITDEATFRQLHAKAEKAVAAVVDDRRKLKRIIKDIYQPIQYVHVGESDERRLELPHDYQYDDAEPESEVSPGTMFGEEIDIENLEGSLIDAYANWMTSKENPKFTRVIANRLWKKVFGAGVFEPVDEITAHTEITNPQLMAYLEQLMKELNYDMQAFLSILYKTQTFQRETSREELLAGMPYYFPGPTFKRMSAEQIWDSMVALSIPGVDQYKPTLNDRLVSVEKSRLIYKALESRDQDEFRQMVSQVSEIAMRSYDKLDDLRDQLYKAREKESSDLVKKLSQEIREEQRTTKKVIGKIAYNGATRTVDGEDLISANGGVAMSDESTRAMHTELPELPKMVPPTDLDKKQQAHWKRAIKYKVRDWHYITKGLMRASEMESPAPRGHFLREFGQSDREIIENSNQEASVPQALNLLNSKTVEILANPFSVLGQTLQAADSPDEQVDAIFQAMLTRKATEEEKLRLTGMLEEDPVAGQRDLIWAILNTQQFVFVR